MIEISQGSVVTQTVLGGLTIYLPVANFICFISAKTYENSPRVDKVIAMNTVCSFLAHPVMLLLKFEIVSFLILRSRGKSVSEHNNIVILGAERQ